VDKTIISTDMPADVDLTNLIFLLLKELINK